MSDDPEKHLKQVLAYHDETKHRPTAYARSLGYMDWDNQPQPFRTYANAPVLELPLKKELAPYSLDQLYQRAVDPVPVNLSSVAACLELSLGLSAWKRYGRNEWSLRMNPSSGNLHPTEAYLLMPSEGGGSAIFHYNPFQHSLERIANAAEAIPTGDGFALVISSIYWREAWKYGERAFRYCHHDVGHALAALSYAAALLGWSVNLESKADSRLLGQILGFDQNSLPEAEREHAHCLCWISPDPNYPLG